MPSISAEGQGRFLHSGGDVVSIGARAYNHSRFGNIPIAVTSSTSFVEKSGNAEWHFTGNSWVVTVLQDIPFVAVEGSVFEFDRLDPKAEAKKAQKDAEKAQKDAEIAGRVAAAFFGVGF
jgi:hypothetical protein|eukprot:GHVU01014529.1.p1 GENE.GHVU01014529.1~~GHVU01014529.1.p1  ORF type:complete len:120 (+),score=24.96 GHVU01014529.1:80-439(+)